MSQDLTLPEKRAELKHQLLPDHYSTLVDTILDRTGRLIQKMSRSSKPLSFVYSALLLSLVAFLIGFLVSQLRGEFRLNYRHQFIPAELLMAGMIFMLLVTLRVYLRFLIRVCRDRLIDNIQNLNDLSDLQTWLTRTMSPGRTALFSVFFALCGLSYFLVPAIAIGHLRSSAIGTATIVGIFLLSVGMAFYYLLRLLSLSLHLSRYDFKVYTLDPRSSEIIEDMSGLVTAFVYLIAAFMAIVTIVLALSGWVTLPVITPVTIMTWLVIIALFVVNQYAMAKIIARAKWKTLNSVQLQIEEMHNQGDLSQKETVEAIDRLMNYHDRIRSTPNTALNFRAGLNFVNSLLLPFVAFLLANLQNIIQFFGE